MRSLLGKRSRWLVDVQARRPSLLLARNLSASARHYKPNGQTAPSQSSSHGNFYKTHGRALFKALTLAFFSYQIFYWAWLTLETESMRDEKDGEIRSLEGEVKLLEEGRKSHRPGQVLSELEKHGRNLLEEPDKKS